MRTVVTQQNAFWIAARIIGDGSTGSLTIAQSAASAAVIRLVSQGQI